MSAYSIGVIVYLLVLVLMLGSILAAAWAWAVQMFVFSCLILFGLGILKRTKK